MKERINHLQILLKERNLYSGKIDGIAGDKTMAAISLLTSDFENWSKRRKIVGALQFLFEKKDIHTGTIDGYWGHLTENAYDQSKYLLENGEPMPIWRPEEILNVNPNNWPSQYSDEFGTFYGEQSSSLVKIELPWEHRLSWNPQRKINSFSCHRKVRNSLIRVLNKIFDHYGNEKIKDLRLDYWGGCFNQRPIRGGTKPSMHSWGIALDYDPVNNRLNWGRNKASFAKLDYNRWWEIWEEEGWVSLGRHRNFDWMHIQAAKI